MGDKNPGFQSQAAAAFITAIVLASGLAGCTTTEALNLRKPTPREQMINSLALEQCIRENGEKGCVGGSPGSSE